MKIHAIASQPHYLAHIEAIHKHLPPEIQGTIWTGKVANDRNAAPEDVFMVAGFSDLIRVRDHRIIYVEHGAGQSYRDVKDGRRGYYHGDPHPERVIAYIAPRQEVADRWERPAFAAGAPICDPHSHETGNSAPVATIGFHWDASLICPEAGTALEHYANDLPRIIARLEESGYGVTATVHPKDTWAPSMWDRLDVPMLPAHEVRRHTDLLIMDNSSLMYELCYLGRTVIALNAPWYRRNVNHGLRFWDWRGWEVDDTETLLRLLSHDLLGDSDINVRMMRSHGNNRDAERAYDKQRSDGKDGERAARWMTKLVSVL